MGLTDGRMATGPVSFGFLTVTSGIRTHSHSLGIPPPASDRQFALSGGVVYKTPEMVFLNSPAPSPDDYHKESFEGDWCGRYTPKTWCKSSTSTFSFRQQ